MNWTFWAIPFDRASTFLFAASASFIRSSHSVIAGPQSRIPFSSA
jgi:hypothetical protein